MDVAPDKARQLIVFDQEKAGFTRMRSTSEINEVRGHFLNQSGH